ncbi:MAG TPA: class I SAM-dependent methyltransferase [Syntrophorhabdaceae bacterium]|nr:class I SAM-dependent methyltransferase [Syntrophorhabdaceae bacterium]
MDMWKFFDITHREHVLCDPISLEKLEHLITLLNLKTGARVLDVATGKGEFLIRLAERYRQMIGTGIDLSPYCIADVRKKHQERVPDARLQFLEMDGAEYVPDTPESFDLVACIGASWIYGGHKGTLNATQKMAAAKSWIVVGEPYWRQEPEREYLEAIGMTQNDFGRHHQNAEAGREFGLELAYTLVSSKDDWDRYEGLQWYAAESWASDHRDDPDVQTVLKRVRESKAAYLRWGRETLGWAIYVFRKGGYEALPVG